MTKEELCALGEAIEKIYNILEDVTIDVGELADKLLLGCGDLPVDPPVIPDNDLAGALALGLTTQEIINFRVTSEITDFSISEHRGFDLRHTELGKWPVTKPGSRFTDGNWCIVFWHNEEKIVRSFEYSSPGDTNKNLERKPASQLLRESLTAYVKNHTQGTILDSWNLRDGDYVGFFKTTLCHDGLRTTDERTNVEWINW